MLIHIRLSETRIGLSVIGVGSNRRLKIFYGLPGRVYGPLVSLLSTPDIEAIGIQTSGVELGKPIVLLGSEGHAQCFGHVAGDLFLNQKNVLYRESPVIGFRP